VPRERMAIAGYADNVPVGSNETEEGRALNRRVDLVILSEQGLLKEPARTAGHPPGPKVGAAGGQGPAHGTKTAIPHS